MRINSINIFSNFAPYYKRPDINSSPNFSNSILSPLKRDTVSFSGAAKLEGRSMVFAPSLKTCQTVRNNAEPAAMYLDTKLHEYLDSINDGCDTGSELITIKTRKKSPSSIKEKAVSKFSKTAGDENKEFCSDAVSEILNYYELKDGFNKTIAEIEAGISIEQPSEFITLPYGNEKFFLNQIISNLEKRGIIEFNASSKETRAKAFEKILNHLKKRRKGECFDINGVYIDPASIAGIKHYANDIIGARIILNDSKAAAQKVMEALKKAANDGALNIVSIENYLPNPKKLPAGEKISSYEYLSARKVSRAAKAMNADYRESESKSGYIAIHVNLDLSGSRFETPKNELNGYQGEIQIIGKNVEELKDVEDLCYKLKDEKSSFSPKYKPFKDYFTKYYKGRNIQDAFNEYTYKLYLAQRKKAKTQKQGLFLFPTLKEMGFDKKLPPELDFNKLREIKIKCSKNSKENS